MVMGMLQLVIQAGCGALHPWIGTWKHDRSPNVWTEWCSPSQVFDGAAYHTHLDNMQRLRKGTLQVSTPPSLL